MHAMAIKINVSRKDQQSLNDMLQILKLPQQKRKFHCTIGFIDKVIPDEETETFGNKVVEALQEHITPSFPLYEVGEAAHLFGHVIAFVPSEKSREDLMALNCWLFEKAQELSEGRWGLNPETIPENYTPHMTLWRTRRHDRRFKSLEEFAKTHPSYELIDPAFVIF